MNFLLSILYVVFAGIINGSFALPTKKIKHWRFENIWLNYAFWSFLFLPWLILYLMSPHAFLVYQQASSDVIGIMLIGGFLFGVGQVCFALSLNMIGLGLGFVINIGLGTGLGFMLPLILLHPEKMFTSPGILTLLGTVFIILGLIYSFFAGRLRDQKKTQNSDGQYFQLGVLLAIVAGIFSAGENFTFAATHSLQKAALGLGMSTFSSANVMWPGFLLASFLPYLIYMFILHFKNNSFQYYRLNTLVKYTPLAFLMAVCWYGSLMIYSKASLMIGELGPVIAWPLFMVMIILSSNFWSWHSGEWDKAGKRAYQLKLRGIICLIAAFVVLALSVKVS